MSSCAVRSVERVPLPSPWIGKFCIGGFWQVATPSKLNFARRMVPAASLATGVEARDIATAAIAYELVLMISPINVSLEKNFQIEPSDLIRCDDFMQSGHTAASPVFANWRYLTA